jgi:hypothetical protein
MGDKKDHNTDSATFWNKSGMWLAGLGSDRVMAEGAWGVYPLEVRVRFPADPDGEFMVVAKGMDASGNKVVAFHSAPDINSAVQGCCSRWQNASLKWRDDKPYKGNS